MAGLGDDVLAEVGLAAAEDDGGEHLPEAMNIADLRGELLEPAGFLAVRSLVRLRSLTRKLLANCSRAADSSGYGNRAWASGRAPVAHQASRKTSGSRFLIGVAVRTSLYRALIWRTPVPMMVSSPFILHAFIHGAGGKGILAEIGQRRGIDALNLDFGLGCVACLGPSPAMRFADDWRRYFGRTCTVGHLSSRTMAFLGWRQVAESRGCTRRNGTVPDFEATLQFAFEGVIGAILQQGACSERPSTPGKVMVGRAESRL